jgi:hypothetical protein
MITFCIIISSAVNTVPPVLIFPNIRLYGLQLFGAPAGSLGLMNSPVSSWITGLLFLKVLEHVKKNTRSAKDHIIQLMVSHKSHCTLDSSLYTTENGITLETSLS